MHAEVFRKMCTEVCNVPWHAQGLMEGWKVGCTCGHVINKCAETFMTETAFRIPAGTWENYFTFSERLKIFHINARGGKPVCLLRLCSVKYPRFPWHPVPHPPRPLFPGWRINQNLPLPLTSPTTGLSPGTSSLSGWRLTSLPAPIMNLLEPLPTEPLGWALKNVNQSPSAKLQTTSPLSRLMICSCRMQKNIRESCWLFT